MEIFSFYIDVNGTVWRELVLLNKKENVFDSRQTQSFSYVLIAPVFLFLLFRKYIVSA